ncbi:MFS transporter [Peribacillus deserti]|uniref:MFS transporter n=1 Tax=Peribacillus deserti TaxID=673318 RepID=A0A2N5M1A2_9BACI|nr:MFS transporter [Peribacillus deserti]PLT28130.1 MFS transporter [Peribacillus deserti]
MAKPKLWTKEFLSISFASFFIFLIFYMLTVTLPIYITDELHGSGKNIGIIIPIFVVSAIIFRPFSGIWLDTIGQKKTLFIGVVIFLMGAFLYFPAKSMALMLIVRVIHGIGFGMATTATGAIAAHIIPKERRGEGMGYYATFMNLAMVIGPFLGLTIIGASGYETLFVFSAIFSVLAVVCTLMLKLPQPNRHKAVEDSMKKTIRLSDFFEGKTLPIALVAFALSFVYSGVLSFISVYARELNLVTAASFFFVIYAAFLLISRPFTGRWFDAYGENFVIYPCIILFGLGVWVLSQVSSSFMLLLAGALIGMGFGTLVSCFQTIAVHSSPASRKGIATATFFVVFDSGFAAGSFVLGIIATYTGYSAIFTIGSIIVLFSLGLYYLLHGRKAKGIMNNIESSI